MANSGAGTTAGTTPQPLNLNNALLNAGGTASNNPLGLSNPAQQSILQGAGVQFPNTPLGSIEQSAYAGIQPSLAAGDVNIATLGQQANLIPGIYQAEAGNLQTQTQAELAQNALNASNIGIQGKGLQASGTLLGQQQQQSGLQYALQKAGFRTSLASLQNQLGVQQRQQQESGVASGSLNTAGYAFNQGQLQKQYGFNLADIQNQIKSAALGYKGQQEQYAYSKGALQRQEQTLGNLAKSNNISAGELKQRLGYALDQLGLSNTLSVGQLIDEIQNANAGQVSTVQQAFGPISILAGAGLLNQGAQNTTPATPGSVPYAPGKAPALTGP